MTNPNSQTNTQGHWFEFKKHWEYLSVSSQKKPGVFGVVLVLLVQRHTGSLKNKLYKAHEPHSCPFPATLHKINSKEPHLCLPLAQSLQIYFTAQ